MGEPGIAMELTWPEGRSPGNGYPLCPDCGHDFGKHTPGPIRCFDCRHAGANCVVDAAAVFAAIDEVTALVQSSSPAATDEHAIRERIARDIEAYAASLDGSAGIMSRILDPSLREAFTVCAAIARTGGS